MSNFAADLRPCSSSILAAVVADDKASVQFFDAPRWREAAFSHGNGTKVRNLTFRTDWNLATEQKHAAKCPHLNGQCIKIFGREGPFSFETAHKLTHDTYRTGALGSLLLTRK